MHSIRAKITAITIVAILTSIVALFAASYTTVQEETDQNSVSLMNLIGHNTQKSLEKYFESIEQSVELTANIAIDSLDSVLLVECGAVRTDAGPISQTDEQREKLDEYLAAYCGRIQEFFSGVASYTHGVAGYYYCINPEISPSAHGFYYAKMGKTGFAEQESLDVSRLDPEDMAHNAWYFTALERGRPSWIGPYRSNTLNDAWACSYIVPIYKSGAMIGLLGMDIPFDTLTEQISSIQVYQTGFASLCDAEGRVLYHPELPFGSVPDIAELSVRRDMLQYESNGGQMIRYTANGEKQQMSFFTLPNDMKLVITVPTREINAPWTRLVKIVLMITAVVIAAGAVLTAIIVRIITHPLKELTTASQRLADADYDVNLKYKGKDEIGTLTEAFTAMRDRIKRSIEDLNHQILTDKLTGLPNMRYFFRLAETERKRLLDEGGHPVMLYFDIAGIKHYNRQYGFEKGDGLICAFANILLRQFGDRRLCRFSEDHFAAVTDEEHVDEEVREIFRQCQTADNGKPMIIRVGVYPNSLEKVDVNVACDRAKFACDQNRGALASTVCYFDEDMLRNGDVYRYIVNNLDRALAEGWVKVYYQPIIRAADGKVCDEEALSRWIDPVMGFLSPADFIPALEEAKLIYRLDLYVVEQVLAKMKKQAEAGLYVVPQSINLSRNDFDSCDIVEEIRRRVDEAGIERRMISVEITESVIGSDFDFMKEQVERFQKLGFEVWMDDFGSGYSSLDVLQNIRFDLLKFDMRFMERFGSGDESKIILTELTKMAIGLGLETVCEGVEQEEQVEFLREIGCTKIQGYYYGKPISFDAMLSMFEKGMDMGFENPEEMAYYASIGRVNLYDMAVLSSEDDESLQRYFNTLPMSIIEVNGTRVRYNRCNKSYRDFLERTMGAKFSTEALDYSEMPNLPGSVFMGAVMRCSKDGKRAIVDEKINEDTSIHALIRRVAVNPVTGTSAIAAAVLAVIKEGENAGTNYAHIAKALSADYLFLYYVNLDTEAFIEYSPDAARENLALERHGDHFFSVSRKEAETRLHKDDQEYFLSAFTRENIEKILDAEGTFTLTYRLLIDGKPTYVNMKAVRMQADRSHIIIGVNNVDAQMRQKETLARIQAERTTYSRVTALTQDFIAIYTIDPATSRYIEYSASRDYAGLNMPKEGEDFFAQAHKESAKYVYPEDREKFQAMLTRERVLEEIEKNGIYSFQYRMLLNGEPTYVSLKAALVEEKDGPQLIVGVNNIDAQARREQEYQRKLSAARSEANLDTLTGVKDKKAYFSMSETLARQIEGGLPVQYAIVLCRVKELAQVNEEKGRDAGDQLILDVCAAICDTFKHSPVFRVAGDQFAVIAQGHDFESLDGLLAELKERGRENSGGLALAFGMARYDGVESVASVFERADRLCRENAQDAKQNE